MSPFLRQFYIIDFAGGGTVHLLGGVLAFCGALYAGDRGYAEKAKKYDSHSAIYVVIGSLILWMGWLAFNAGSVGDFSFTGYLLAVRIALNTLITPCVSFVTCIAWNILRNKKK